MLLKPKYLDFGAMRNLGILEKLKNYEKKHKKIIKKYKKNENKKRLIRLSS